MPTVESVKNDIVALGTAGQEDILHYMYSTCQIIVIFYFNDI